MLSLEEGKAKAKLFWKHWISSLFWSLELEIRYYVLNKTTFGCWARRRPPWLLDKFIPEAGCRAGGSRKESEKRVKSKLQKCNSPTSSAAAAGGKANTIRAVFRIFTMSTSTRGCNNCSFSAKKMHFGAKREVLRRGAMGVGCHAMQCCKGTSLRIAERGGCEFRRLALMGMDLSEVTLMWYDRPCPAATLQCKVELWCDTQGRLAAAAWHCRVKAKIWARPQHHHSLHARQCFPLGKSPFRF